MSQSHPIRMAAFLLTLVALTVVFLSESDGDPRPRPTENPVASNQLTVPVEILETGKSPTLKKVRVAR